MSVGTASRLVPVHTLFRLECRYVDCRYQGRKWNFTLEKLLFNITAIMWPNPTPVVSGSIFSNFLFSSSTQSIHHVNLI